MLLQRGTCSCALAERHLLLCSCREAPAPVLLQRGTCSCALVRFLDAMDNERLESEILLYTHVVMRGDGDRVLYTMCVLHIPL